MRFIMNNIDLHSIEQGFLCYFVNIRVLRVCSADKKYNCAIFLSLGWTHLQLEEKDKLLKRKQRFGVTVTASPGDMTEVSLNI